MKIEKTLKIVYWTTNILFSVLMLFSASQYLTNDTMKEAFVHLGFPSYFRVELAVAKFIGVIVLLLPLSKTLKQWTYSGFSIVLVSAFVAHYSVNDEVGKLIAPVVIGLILLASYFSYQKLNEIKDN